MQAMKIYEWVEVDSTHLILALAGGRFFFLRFPSRSVTIYK